MGILGVAGRMKKWDQRAREKRERAARERRALERERELEEVRTVTEKCKNEIGYHKARHNDLGFRATYTGLFHDYAEAPRWVLEEAERRAGYAIWVGEIEQFGVDCDENTERIRMTNWGQEPPDWVDRWEVSHFLRPWK